MLARPRFGPDKVHDIGDPVMLAQGAKQSEHKPIIPYDDIAAGPFNDALAEMPRRLDEERAK